MLHEMPNDRRMIEENASSSSERRLDSVNRRILEELALDARLPVATLARRVGMSAPAVAERLARLRDVGILRGFALDLDPAALGLPIQAHVRLRPSPGHLPAMARVAQESPEVLSCDRVTGEDCFAARVAVRDLSHLEQVLDRFLVHGQTTTSIVQSSPVPPRLPPLPGAG